MWHIIGNRYKVILTHSSHMQMQIISVSSVNCMYQLILQSLYHKTLFGTFSHFTAHKGAASVLHGHNSITQRPYHWDMPGGHFSCARSCLTGSAIQDFLQVLQWGVPMPWFFFRCQVWTPSHCLAQHIGVPLLPTVIFPSTFKHGCSSPDADTKLWQLMGLLYSLH